MKRSKGRLNRIVSAVTCLLVATATVPAALRPEAVHHRTAATTGTLLPQPLSQSHLAPDALPPVFTANKGQLDSRVRFSWSGIVRFSVLKIAVVQAAWSKPSGSGSIGEE